MTSVEICNLALSMIGVSDIRSFDDESNQARQCKALFPVLRDRVLRDHTWSFATSGCDLQRLAEASFDPDFEFCCLLPSDFIRLIRLVGNEPYRMNGKRILVHRIPVRLLYIRRVDDSGEFDPTFTEALQYLLAAEITMSNTRDAGMSQFLRQEYERRLMIARSIDSQENIHVIQRQGRKSSFLSARVGGAMEDSERIPLQFTEGNAGRQ